MDSGTPMKGSAVQQQPGSPVIAPSGTAAHTKFYLHIANNDSIGASTDTGLGENNTLQTQHLEVARLSLARTRNRTESKMCSLPPEILLNIFSEYIYDYQRAEETRMATDKIYTRLHTLMAVCSIWRRNCISHSPFWSLIPIFGSSSVSHQKTLQSLHYATGNPKFHLVAILEHFQEAHFSDILGQLARRGQRLHFINISCEDQIVAKELLEYFLDLDNPSSILDSITELSICAEFSLIPQLQGLDQGNPPEKSHFIFSPQSGYQMKLLILLKSLPSLRLRGVHLHLTNGDYANLSKLWLQELDLPSTELEALVRSISSASNLRTLHFISIVAFQGVNRDALVGYPRQKFSFPHLEELHITDVRFNVLKALLLSIEPRPRSHQMTLGLCASPSINHLSQEALKSLFQGANVTTLKLARIRWDIHRILSCVPTVVNLWIDTALFDKPMLEKLTWSPDPIPGSVAHPPKLPAIRNLIVTRALITDHQAFTDFVTSHPICRTFLGATVFVDGAWEQCRVDSPMTEWFEVTLPGLNLVEPLKEPIPAELVWTLGGGTTKTF